MFLTTQIVFSEPVMELATHSTHVSLHRLLPSELETTIEIKFVTTLLSDYRIDKGLNVFIFKINSDIFLPLL